jgi:hypothetical protein
MFLFLFLFPLLLGLLFLLFLNFQLNDNVFSLQHHLYFLYNLIKGLLNGIFLMFLNLLI